MISRGQRRIGVGSVVSLTALLASLLALVLGPATAAAAETAATGNTTLVVSPGKAKKLEKRGVSFSGIGGALSDGREIRLQIVGGTVGAGEARLVHSGGLRLLAGEGRERRVVRLTGLETVLGAESTLRGKLKGKERALFELKAKPGAPALDGLRGTASLGNTNLFWDRDAARAISKRLGVDLPKGRFGTVRSSAVARAADTPVSGPISNEPPLLARPATAVNISGATVTWWVRSSWINYVATGAGTSAIEGAVPGAAIAESGHPCLDDSGGETVPRVYDFTFPFVSGWYDPPTGTSAIYGSGGVHFSFPGHGIELTARNPEIELNGTASRAIFRLKGSGSTAYPDARAALLDLHPLGAPVESPPGTFTYAASSLRGSLTADGLKVFGGFYSPPSNHGFGCFAVSFSTG
jgi:hypothetical protein